MTTVEEPNPTLASPLTTTYKYYGFGPLYQSNQSGQLRTFVYNWLGQMTSQTLPESGTMTFVYDDAGRLTSKTDARSVTTSLGYDDINRLTAKSYSDGTPTVTIGFDANGFTGLRTSMTDGLGSVTYSYDAMNRLTQESRTLTGVTGTFTTGYAYNIKGDLTSMTYPSGRQVDFNYATGRGCCNSRLASVVDQTTSTTVNSGMNYNAAGELLNSTLGNCLVQTFGYNNRLQQTSITAAVGATTIMDFSYNYGTSAANTGRVLSRTDAIQPEHSAAYAYDSIYRLNGVTAADATTSWGIAWTFDVWGNRLTQTPSGLAASKIGSQISGYTNNRNNTFTYDAAGNQTNDGLHNYTFNAENQITQMDAGAAVYGYDGEGRRMKKTAGSETTYYFYGPPGLLCEFSTSTTISSATSASSTDRTLYHTTDKLGSAVLVINAAGLVIENNRTLPYGEAWQAESTPATNEKKFTTYQRDQESGLDYAMDRYSQSTVGRFTSPDKGSIHMQLSMTLNRYIYGGDDPINHTDKSGNDWIDDILTPWDAAAPYEAWVWATAGQNMCFSVYGLGPSAGCPGYGSGPGAEWLALLAGPYDPSLAAAVPGSPPPSAANVPCEQQAVQDVIMADAGNVGVPLGGYQFRYVSIAGATTFTNGVSYDSQTELFLDATGDAWKILQDYFNANSQQWEPGGYDPMHGVYTQSYRQKTGDGQWSMQVSYDPKGNIQIDIDPHNPKQNLFAHTLDVIGNTFSGGDTNYHAAAAGVGVADHPCP